MTWLFDGNVLAALVLEGHIHHARACYEMTTWFNMAEIERGSYDLILDGFFLRLGYGW